MNRSTLRFPKPKHRPPVIAEAPDHVTTLVGPLAPAERLALRDICELADTIKHDRRQFLLVPVTSRIIDVLAAFEAEAAEVEQDDFGGDNSEDEGEPDHDNEYDFLDAPCMPDALEPSIQQGART